MSAYNAQLAQGNLLFNKLMDESSMQGDLFDLCDAILRQVWDGAYGLPAMHSLSQAADCPGMQSGVHEQVAELRRLADAHKILSAIARRPQEFTEWLNERTPDKPPASQLRRVA